MTGSRRGPQGKNVHVPDCPHTGRGLQVLCVSALWRCHCCRRIFRFGRIRANLCRQTSAPPAMTVTPQASRSRPVAAAVVEIALVAALDENGVIGADGGMPWHLPADLRHFKRTTLHKPIVMGRRTHESIGRALPGRRNLVLTRDPHYRAEGCECVTSLAAARRIAAADGAAQLAVIGGAQVYKLALPLAQRLYLTRIHARYDGDTWFPEVDWSLWQLLSSRRRQPDNTTEPACSFMEWQR